MNTVENTTAGSPRSRNLQLADIPKLASFAPADWNVSLDAVLLQHCGRPYFHARVIVDAGAIVAVGHGIDSGPVGWVGNIIVRPDTRNRGFGTRITSEVIGDLRLQGCTTLLLIATRLGEPVYRKLGFSKTGEYIFLRVPALAPLPDPSIRRLQPTDAHEVYRLDTVATGESRAHLLAPHIAAGWGRVGENGMLDGFFLPSFGSGFIMACEAAGGRALLRFKHSLYPGNAVIPAANPNALEFLLRHGAETTGRAPRMAMADDSAWRPEMIFARTSGYCG